MKRFTLKLGILFLISSSLLNGGPLPAQANPPLINTAAVQEAPIPLSQIQKVQQTSPTNDGTLPRMLFSLGLVLLMLYGTLKLGLPKLVERYPALLQFFRNRGEALPLFSPQNFQALKKAAATINTTTPEAKFKVLTSKVLGVGRELHLVEINGRQLVIGSTAQHMTLLTQWPTETENSTAPDQAIEEFSNLCSPE